MNEDSPSVVTKPAFWTDLVKFSVVGLTAAVFDIGLLNLLYLKVGTNLYVATGVAFLVASTVAYLLNNHWTYRHLNLPAGAVNLVKYTLIGLVGLAITEGIVRLLVGNYDLNYNLAKVIAIGVVALWNFFGNRYWTFRPIN